MLLLTTLKNQPKFNNRMNSVVFRLQRQPDLAANKGNFICNLSVTMILPFGDFTSRTFLLLFVVVVVVVCCCLLLFVPTGGKPNQRFACFYVFHGGKGVGWGGDRKSVV